MIKQWFEDRPYFARLIIGCLLITSVIFSSSVLPTLPFGKQDLRGYWSASYLLRQGEAFGDRELMEWVQQELTDYDDSVILTWNPPWLLIILIPLTFFPFHQAIWLWIILSVGLFFVGGWWLIKRFGGNSLGILQTVWGLSLAMLMFAPLWVNIMMGQVSVLVFWGLAGYFYFQDKSPFLAGLFLAVTTIKPHILFLLLPVILIHALWRQEWRILAGFFTFLIISVLLTFILRPTFLQEYFSTLFTHQTTLLVQPTPTLSNILALLLGQDWLRFVGLGIVPLVLVYWWRVGRHLNQEGWLNMLTFLILLSTIFMPYGYSFDFTTLFMPTILVMVWIMNRNFSISDSRVILILFWILNILFIYQHGLNMNHFYFAWYPIALALLFGYIVSLNERKSSLS